MEQPVPSMSMGSPPLSLDLGPVLTRKREEKGAPEMSEAMIRNKQAVEKLRALMTGSVPVSRTPGPAPKVESVTGTTDTKLGQTVSEKEGAQKSDLAGAQIQMSEAMIKNRQAVERLRAVLNKQSAPPPPPVSGPSYPAQLEKEMEQWKAQMLGFKNGLQELIKRASQPVQIYVKPVPTTKTHRAEIEKHSQEVIAEREDEGAGTPMEIEEERPIASKPSPLQERDVQGNERRIQLVKEQLRAAHDEHQKTKQLLSSMETQKGDLEGQVKLLKEQLRDSEAGASDLKGETELIKERVKALEKAKEELQKESDQIKKGMMDLQKNTEQLQQALDTERSNNTDLLNQIGQLTQRLGSNQNSMRLLREANEQKINSLRQELQSTKELLSMSQEQLAATQKELIDTRVQREELEKSAAALGADVKKKEEEIGTLQGEKAKLKVELEGARSAVEEQKSEKQELTQKIGTLRQQIEAKEEALQKAEQEREAEAKNKILGVQQEAEATIREMHQLDKTARSPIDLRDHSKLSDLTYKADELYKEQRQKWALDKPLERQIKVALVNQGNLERKLNNLRPLQNNEEVPKELKEIYVAAYRIILHQVTFEDANLRKLYGRVAGLEQKEKNLETVNEALKKELEQKTKEIEKAAKEMEAFQKQASSVQGQSQQQIKAMELEMQEKVKEHQASLVREASLKKELQELKQKESDMLVRQATAEEIQKQTALKRDALEKDLQAKEQQLKLKEEETKGYATQIQNMQKEASERASELQRMKEDSTKVDEEMRALEDEADQLRKENQEMAEQLEQLKSEQLEQLKPSKLEQYKVKRKISKLEAEKTLAEERLQSVQQLAERQKEERQKMHEAQLERYKQEMVAEAQKTEQERLLKVQFQVQLEQERAASQAKFAELQARIQMLENGANGVEKEARDLTARVTQAPKLATGKKLGKTGSGPSKPPQNVQASENSLKDLNSVLRTLAFQSQELLDESSKVRKLVFQKQNHIEGKGKWQQLEQLGDEIQQLERALKEVVTFKEKLDMLMAPENEKGFFKTYNTLSDAQKRAFVLEKLGPASKAMEAAKQLSKIFDLVKMVNKSMVENRYNLGVENSPLLEKFDHLSQKFDSTPDFGLGSLAPAESWRKGDKNLVQEKLENLYNTFQSKPKPK